MHVARDAAAAHLRDHLQRLAQLLVRPTLHTAGLHVSCQPYNLFLFCRISVLLHAVVDLLIVLT